MDKRIILAMAGSGKTEYIIDNINKNKRTAIIAYTIANQKEIEQRIIKKKGELPNNIHIFGFWQFVYNFCLIPLIKDNFKGIIFQEVYQKLPPYQRRGYSIKEFFMENKISKYLINKNVPYLDRIQTFFDEIFIDEIQDFDSYDLDWIFSLSKLNIPVTLVGDYYQKTFSTSKVGNKGKGITKNYVNYVNAFKNNGFKVDETTLIKSKRCTKSVCDFIQNKIGISILSSEDKKSDVRLVTNKDEINDILRNDDIIKLFLREYYKWDVSAGNWGGAKGLTFSNVCVILNDKTFKLLTDNMLSELAVTTKAKFYVACTRTKNNLYFISQKQIPKKFKK